MRHARPALLRAALVAVLSLGGTGRSSSDDATRGLAPILRDECGLPGRAPHLVRGQPWTFGTEDADGGLQQRTIAFDPVAVVLRYDGLDAAARYAVRVAYVTERGGPRIQRLLANGTVVHEALALPRGRAAAYEYPLPGGIVRDGGLALEFQRVEGPNAVVSVVELLSDRPAGALTVSAEPDSAESALTITVLDGMLRPATGARVTVSAGGAIYPARAPAVSGTLVWRVPEELAGRCDLEVSVTAERAGTTATSQAVLIRHAPPDYVPVPVRVAGVRTPTMSLDGRWLFAPTPAGEFWAPGADRRSWRPIRVPAEWVLQGFTVPEGVEAAYCRTFGVPADWRGKRVRLQFGAAFCDARVWVNGRLVAEHRGGFTPFEADVTTALRPGPNTLVVGVRDDTITNLLSKGSQYAYHRIGGILRGVRLYALPRAYLGRLHVRTDLDRAYRDAVLRVDCPLVGEVGGATALRFDLAGPDGRPVRLSKAQVGRSPVLLPVRAPRKWTAETPYLYTLTARVLHDGREVERVTKRIGFRTVEVRGRRLLVNGRPVKLRGVDRHEVHPTMGRAAVGLWRTDARLFKEANANFVRTSHYPPAPEFLDACDEVGLYVIDEAALIWVNENQANDPSLRDYFTSAAAEMAERDRSHPSVILWSLANESAYGANFEAERRVLARADPTRPILFCGAASPADRFPVLSAHYPSPFARYADKRPVLYTEYCHVNCYNRSDLALDPGVRDRWGRYLAQFQQAFDAQDRVIGGAIWAGIDEVFRLPSGPTGYGEWGIIDGYRRRKPEWWHVRKAYAPVRLLATEAPVPGHGRPLDLPVANRYDFLDLRALKVRWRLVSEPPRPEATVACAAPPRSRGTLRIRAPLRTGDVVEIAFYLHGAEVNRERVYIGAPPAARPPEPRGRARMWQDDRTLSLTGAYSRAVLSKRTGLITSMWMGPLGAPMAGPALHVLALGDNRTWPDPGSWHLSALETTDASTGPTVVTARGEYEGARGYFRYAMGWTGALRIDYAFECTASAPLSPREWGLRFEVGRDHDLLAWRRRSEWSVYPSDHIGRPAGAAWAEAAADGAVPWSALGGALGSNDFRSTKYDALWAALARPDGTCLVAWPGGTGHTRACLAAGGAALYVNAYSNGGSEGFLAASIQPERAPIRTGSILRGTVYLSRSPHLPSDLRETWTAPSSR